MGCGGSKSTNVVQVEPAECAADSKAEKVKLLGANSEETNTATDVPGQVHGHDNSGEPNGGAETKQDAEPKQETKITPVVKKPNVGTLKFSVARHVVTGRISEPLYAVEMAWAARVWSRWHHTLASCPVHLDALGMDTGFCRSTLHLLQPAEVYCPVEWHAWQKWHPVQRGSVPVLGVSWTLGQQLGVIDDLLFDGTEPSLSVAADAGEIAERLKREVDPPVPEGKVCDCIRARAERFGMKIESVSATSTGDYVVALPETQAGMPDPCFASDEALSEWLPDLLIQNPDEEENCLIMARWQYALRERKKYMAMLPRPGCWNDLPFYSLVVPLSTHNQGLPFCKRRHACAEQPPESNEPPRSLEQYIADLAEASDTSLDESDAEAARMALVKSLKWSVGLPSALWHADPQTSKWSRTEADMLRADVEKEPPFDFKLPPGGALARAEFPAVGVAVEGEEGAAAWEETLRGGQAEQPGLDMTFATPVWAEPAADAISTDTLAEGQSKPRRRRAWTEELWQKIKDKGLSDAIKAILTEEYSPEKPQAWMTEKLIPEDNSPKVAAEERAARRQSFLDECSRDRERREEEGAALVAWPSDRKWPATEPSAAFKKMVEKMQMLETNRKGGA